MLHHARDCSLMPVIILAMIGQMEHLPITAHAALSRQQSNSGALLGQARGTLLLPAPAFTLQFSSGCPGRFATVCSSSQEESTRETEELSVLPGF